MHYPTFPMSTGSTCILYSKVLQSVKPLCLTYMFYTVFSITLFTKLLLPVLALFPPKLFSLQSFFPPKWFVTMLRLVLYHFTSVFVFSCRIQCQR